MIVPAARVVDRPSGTGFKRVEPESVCYSHSRGCQKKDRMSRADGLKNLVL